MSLQKTLCYICESPTADGAVPAVHVDKEKLQTWFLNVCEFEMAEEIEDEDKICYFCLWDAEFLWKFDEMADEHLVWWPRNSDHLDNAAKELRKYYFEGSVEQCWVQLEKLELPETRDKDNRTRRWKCIYCRKRFKYSGDLSKHVKKMHKEAIRCENWKCATYFHTLEEKEEHNKNFHEKSKEREKINCSFCGKEYKGPTNYNSHIRKVHKDFPVKCSQFGCISYFKTKIEMKIHFDFTHGEGDKAKKFKCNDCDYKTRNKCHLELHITGMHWPKSIKCKICEKLFSTDVHLRVHVRIFHNFKVCKFCKLALTVKRIQSNHLKIITCCRCNNKFHCSGLYQSHLKSCRKTRFICDMCSNSYNKKSRLISHMRLKHIR